MSEYTIKNLREELFLVSDIVFSRGKQRVVRSIPVPLQDLFVPVMREILCLHKVKGRSLMDFVNMYTTVESGWGTRFFLQDEKEIIHRFLENCTRFAVWEARK